MAKITKASLSMRYIASLLTSLEFGRELPPLTEGLTWADIYQMAKRHTIASTLWYVLEGTKKEEIPSEIASSWERQRTVDFAKHHVQSAEFLGLTRLLSDNQIPFLPMKGFLWKAIWSKPEYRTMADMDFLVAEDMMQTVDRLLLANGYTVDTKGGIVHDTYDKPPYIHVEVHKALRVGSTESFENWTPKEDNPYWYLMNDVDFLVFNIAHIYKHYTTGGPGARSLFDIYLFLERRGDGIDGESLKTRLEEEKLYDFYHSLLHLIYFWFDDPVARGYTDKRYIDDKGNPTDTLLEMEYFIATGGAYGNATNRVQYSITTKGKLRHYLGMAFPSPKAIFTLYPVVKWIPILLPFGYIWRLIASLFNGKFKKTTGDVRNAEASRLK